MEVKNLIVLCLLGLVLIQGVLSQSNALDEDLVITKSQKVALDKLKERVLNILPHEYMKQDIYLIKWLRAKNFNVDEAEEFLKEDLKWRKDNKMDEIHKEDFSDIMEEFPVFIDTVDKNGAPVVTAQAGQFNLRQAALTGRGERLYRYLYKVMDEAAMRVRDAQLQGKNVTRFHFLLNLEGFNLVQHGCPRCILGILNFIQAYENHFPGMTDRIVIFNAPTSIQALRPIVRGAISSRTRGNIKLFGTNKQEFTNYLLQFINADQLTEDFGGTRVRKA